MKKESNSMLVENDVAQYVRKAVEDYFNDLDGEDPSCAVYDMVMNCVEKPLIEAVLKHACGNQTRAAELLGLNRNTLRKKIQQHRFPGTDLKMRVPARSERKVSQKVKFVNTNDEKNT
uniref:Fis-like DNA-binding protein (Modular protein) n=1 Tax=Candidatus Nitrotoga fabula TaxID=2182327 RepID=A0A2X0QR89_9PROT|nr:Putative Fis-like DNA-binding protein (modular protein) [Candidatus Nitrotoga fabula]